VKAMESTLGIARGAARPPEGENCMRSRTAPHRSPLELERPNHLSMSLPGYCIMGRSETSAVAMTESKTNMADRHSSMRSMSDDLALAATTCPW
jgi:hypothetical protein